MGLNSVRRATYEADEPCDAIDRDLGVPALKVQLRLCHIQEALRFGLAHHPLSAPALPLRPGTDFAA